MPKREKLFETKEKNKKCKRPQQTINWKNPNVFVGMIFQTGLKCFCWISKVVEALPNKWNILKEIYTAAHHRQLCFREKNEHNAHSRVQKPSETHTKNNGHSRNTHPFPTWRTLPWQRWWILLCSLPQYNTWHSFGGFGWLGGWPLEWLTPRRLIFGGCSPLRCVYHSKIYITCILRKSNQQSTFGTYASWAHKDEGVSLHCRIIFSAPSLRSLPFFLRTPLAFHGHNLCEMELDNIWMFPYHLICWASLKLQFKERVLLPLRHQIPHCK